MKVAGHRLERPDRLRAGRRLWRRTATRSCASCARRRPAAGRVPLGPAAGSSTRARSRASTRSSTLPARRSRAAGPRRRSAASSRAACSGTRLVASAVAARSARRRCSSAPRRSASTATAATSRSTRATPPGTASSPTWCRTGRRPPSPRARPASGSCTPRFGIVQSARRRRAQDACSRCSGSGLGGRLGSGRQYVQLGRDRRRRRARSGTRSSRDELVRARERHGAQPGDERRVRAHARPGAAPAGRAARAGIGGAGWCSASSRARC